MNPFPAVLAALIVTAIVISDLLALQNRQAARVRVVVAERKRRAKS